MAVAFGGLATPIPPFVYRSLCAYLCIFAVLDVRYDLFALRLDNELRRLCVCVCFAENFVHYPSWVDLVDVGDVCVDWAVQDCRCVGVVAVGALLNCSDSERLAVLPRLFCRLLWTASDSEWKRVFAHSWWCRGSNVLFSHAKRCARNVSQIGEQESQDWCRGDHIFRIIMESYVGRSCKSVKHAKHHQKKNAPAEHPVCFTRCTKSAENRVHANFQNTLINSE